MKCFNFLSFTILSLLVISCETDISSKDFTLSTKDKKDTYTIGTPYEIEVINLNDKKVDSIVFFKNNERLSSATIPNTNEKLGIKSFMAKVYAGDQEVVLRKNIQVFAATAGKVYNYKIINEYPHDPKAFTQGLEFYNDTLYESTGQRGFSQLRKLDYKTGKVLKAHNLDNQYFAEGITFLNDQIYQLTWQRKIGFIYNPATFEEIKTFPYKKSKEGWGICNDGKVLYKSDGTEKIWTLDPNTMEELDYIQITTRDKFIPRVNELEYINGKIYANIWQEDAIAIINPKTGAVEGAINGKRLKDKVTKHPKLDVLNGIAYNPKTNTIFVTGKNWDKLFEIEIIE